MVINKPENGALVFDCRYVILKSSCSSAGSGDSSCACVTEGASANDAKHINNIFQFIIIPFKISGLGLPFGGRYSGSDRSKSVCHKANASDGGANPSKISFDICNVFHRPVQ